MNFSYNMEIADLEEEVRKTNYTEASVFGPNFGQKSSGDIVTPSPVREPNRQHLGNREAEARKAWRPKTAGDFTVEVKRSRAVERPHPKAPRY